MKTLMFDAPYNFYEITMILKNGGLIAIPTETVYGLAGNGFNEVAVSNIFKAKGRPSDNPLILHISSLDMLDDIVLSISDEAQKLMDAFWPGPLTLIFPATEKVPKIITAGLPTVAVRFPSHPIMRKIIENCKFPLAAPSANSSGKPSPTLAKRVMEDLSGKIDGVIDGGKCDIGIESTVVDVATLTILRPGFVTESMLQQIVPAIKNTSIFHQEKPISPGMKYTHYSPNAQVQIVQGKNYIETIKNLIEQDLSKNKYVGVLATDETLHNFANVTTLSVGSQNNLGEIASSFFEILRKFDDLGVEKIYSLSFSQEGIGEAIMNRLEKSAGYNIINC
ncbi:threonylcarbamoyl-AMP synthase [Candidatus Epulonipiscium fishelsonii]|uniref:Threonylcarbamoyl-AMP synthase n=2 Tax=Candidatus Epulonipiscium fishelsonii TaxID=77094 RepID=A0ACC8XCV4_9FIRM|nr:threonylcarbamoyl-AMP synthase [Epulopiscium sp. SCG-B11WGA-EpuloA1]ONI41614.1 threonylcarbamoyl-AMP synthase [Epulopiscium sp. SCG-B11WGA-EpuloA1]ONI43926.1 threonylcarbamoyl-AMP synthase [Epulopiscium sp. SCG-B05WGA-EpuloA1]